MTEFKGGAILYQLAKTIRAKELLSKNSCGYPTHSPLLIVGKMADQGYDHHPSIGAGESKGSTKAASHFCHEQGLHYIFIC